MNRKEPPPSAGPSEDWPHRPLWEGVRSALLALPAYFRSDTFIEGVNATDAEIAAAFDRLRRRVDDVRSDPVKTSVLSILSSLEKHLEALP